MTDFVILLIAEIAACFLVMYAIWMVERVTIIRRRLMSVREKLASTAKDLGQSDDPVYLHYDSHCNAVIRSAWVLSVPSLYLSRVLIRKSNMPNSRIPSSPNPKLQEAIDLASKESVYHIVDYLLKATFFGFFLSVTSYGFGKLTKWSQKWIDSTVPDLLPTFPGKNNTKR